MISNRSLFLLFVILFIPNKVFSAEVNKYVQFDFDNPAGTYMPGWVYFNETDNDGDSYEGFGANSEQQSSAVPGWRKDGGSKISGSTNFQPRSAEKRDYGNDTRAVFDTSVHSMSDGSVASLKLYDTGDTSIYQPSWWLWYSPQPLGDNSGYTWAGDRVTDTSTNRWSFYTRKTGTTGEEATGNGIHIGTYLCGYDSCPTEGPGDQHWYFYITGFPNDMWVHVLLDRHPSHRRGACDSADQAGCVSGDDPAYDSDGMHFYNNLHQYYMEIRDPQPDPSTLWVDDVFFYQETETQNESSITSLWVGFKEEDSTWRLGFQDMSFQTSAGPGIGSGDFFSTFEVRWSTSPITGANFTLATVISPNLYGGEEYTSMVNGFRRVSDSSTVVYTSFNLPPEVITDNDTLYFAVKDVSVSGGNAGTLYPWNRTDGHDAASPYIKTIDYQLRSTSSIGGKLQPGTGAVQLGTGAFQ